MFVRIQSLCFQYTVKCGFIPLIYITLLYLAEFALSVAMNRGGLMQHFLAYLIGLMSYLWLLQLPNIELKAELLAIKLLFC